MQEMHNQDSKTFHETKLENTDRPRWHIIKVIRKTAKKLGSFQNSYKHSGVVTLTVCLGQQQQSYFFTGKKSELNLCPVTNGGS